MSESSVPFGKISENQIFLNPWGNHGERIVGEVKENADQSVKYFTDRFSDLEAKIAKLEGEIATSQNKGSFLMKLIHLKELITTHDGLGDYLSLELRLTAQEEALQSAIEQNRQRNSDIKTALLEEIRIAADRINWKEATEEIHEIKSKWIKTGNPREKDHENLEQEFWSILDSFFEKKKEFYEDKKRLGEKRKRAYRELVDEAKRVPRLEEPNKSAKIAALKDAWEEIGNIQKEDYDPLIKAFKNNLTAKAPVVKESSVNIDKIFATIDDYTSGRAKYGFKQLEALKVQLKGFRPQDQSGKNQRQDAFESIQMLLERDFIDKLANKRFKNFRELEKPKKQKIRLGILEELINRDKGDLEKFQENSANFSSPKGGMMDIVERKISQQHAKITLKEKLLKKMQTES